MGYAGVESVKADVSSNKLTVFGKVDPAKVREQLAAKIKKKVDLVSGPQPKKEAGGGDKKPDEKSEKKTEEKKPDEKKPEDKKPKEVNPICTIFLFYI